ncbi:MAG TPA: ABC transporter ATP-binding protein [Myxococcota bacterium]|nr:ABC transporter ATP-binding protein [Myxococcota bacterium]
MRSDDAALLEVDDLRVHVATPEGELRAVDGLSLRIGRGEVLGLVGESGCGKSLAALALLDLVPPPARRVGGRIALGGVDLAAGAGRALRAARGRRIALVFQDAAASLTPTLRVGEQLVEAAAIGGASVRDAAARARALLERVGLGGERVFGAWPHQLSGGQRQRALLAMALLGEPAVLVADEPTTALDVTTQASVLALLRELQRERGLAVLFITHDLAVAAALCQRIAVMYAGRVVEEAPTEALFAGARHPYASALLACSAPLDGPRLARLPSIPGAPPRRFGPAVGCAFAPRCPDAQRRCVAEDPPWVALGASHAARCVLALGAGDAGGRRG